MKFPATGYLSRQASGFRRQASETKPDVRPDEGDGARNGRTNPGLTDAPERIATLPAGNRNRKPDTRLVLPSNACTPQYVDGSAIPCFFYA